MVEQVVVVGVDGSPASFTALRWALAHAEHTDAQVRTVRCWMPVRENGNGWEPAATAEPVRPRAEQEVRAERELADVVAAARRQVPGGAAQVAVQRRVVRGPTGPMLVGEADGAALLVVGRRGHRRIAELLHRSVSSYCERHATCPVLVIPPAMATRRALGAQRGFALVRE
ncbi:MAG: universal stress protein [Pseudonocardiaceae bacterium]